MHTIDHAPASRQRGPHNDPAMLDGDSAHGSPDVLAGDEWAVDTDTDVPDAAPDDLLEEVVDHHTPDAEAERMEEEEEDGEVGEGEDVGDEDDEPDADATDDTDVDAEAAEDADDRDIESEGDARGPDPAGTTLEVELKREMDRDSTPARPSRGKAMVAAHGTPPVADYAKLSVPKLLALAADLDADQRAALLVFERANKNRKTLVAKLEKMTLE